jgi:hypothetical protein
MATGGDDFEKGDTDRAHDALELLARTVALLRDESQSAPTGVGS